MCVLGWRLCNRRFDLWCSTLDSTAHDDSGAKWTLSHTNNQWDRHTSHKETDVKSLEYKYKLFLCGFPACALVSSHCMLVTLIKDLWIYQLVSTLVCCTKYINWTNVFTKSNLDILYLYSFFLGLCASILFNPKWRLENKIKVTSEMCVCVCQHSSTKQSGLMERWISLQNSLINNKVRTKVR